MAHVQWAYSLASAVASITAGKDTLIMAAPPLSPWGSATGRKSYVSVAWASEVLVCPCSERNLSLVKHGDVWFSVVLK